MPPNSVEVAREEAEVLKPQEPIPEIKKKRQSEWLIFRDDIRWQTTIILAAVHAIALYGAITFPWIQSYKTMLWCKLLFLKPINSTFL